MRITTLLVLVIVLVFVGVVLLVPDINAFYNTYGFSGVALAERPYILVTSIFLHAGLDHLVANVLVLLFFGFAVEREIGALRTGALFFAGAFAGDLLSVLIEGPAIVAVGASAGIFALIGAGMILRPVDFSFYPLVVPMPLLLLGVAYVVYNVYGFLFLAGSNISYAGHFGGLIIGFAYAFRRKGLKKALITLALGLAAVAALVAAVLLLLPSR